MLFSLNTGEAAPIHKVGARLPGRWRDSIKMSSRCLYATVQLRCGANDIVLGTVQTRADGTFSILLDVSFYTLPQILSGCRVVVTTPLAKCNVSLPSTGTLTSALTSIGSTIVPSLPTSNIGTGVFSVSA
ncbi:hypothetical protein ACLB2K_034824 [Fragaria x ananassa]